MRIKSKIWLSHGWVKICPTAALGGLTITLGLDLSKSSTYISISSLLPKLQMRAYDTSNSGFSPCNVHPVCVTEFFCWLFLVCTSKRASTFTTKACLIICCMFPLWQLAWHHLALISVYFISWQDTRDVDWPKIVLQRCLWALLSCKHLDVVVHWFSVLEYWSIKLESGTDQVTLELSRWVVGICPADHESAGASGANYLISFCWQWQLMLDNTCSKNISI